jgi:hypothetical protein
MDTPVVFLIFNRPDLTAQTFEVLRRIKPKYLRVVSDGPRPHRPDDIPLCTASRAIIEKVDWNCELTRDYSEINLGCGKRVSSGITNAFEDFDEAIILEDDCLPHESFFAFCSEMLARYRNDERIMHVAGYSFQPFKRTPSSYYFSKYTHIWGWGTWKRAWRNYDFKMSSWLEFLDGGHLHRLFPDSLEFHFWENLFYQVYFGKIDTWDYQWQFACLQSGGLGIVPEVNLVTNTGHRSDGTHTKLACSPLGRTAEEIGSLVHPEAIAENIIADKFLFDTVFGGERLRDEQKIRLWTKIRVKQIRNRFRRFFALPRKDPS